MPVKTVLQANTKTRQVKAAVKTVGGVSTKIRMVKQGVKTALLDNIKTGLIKQGVKAVLGGNIKIRIDKQGVNTVVKVIIKTKLDKQDVKRALLVSIQTRMPDLDAKDVETSMVDTNGSRPLALTHLTSTHVTSIKRVHGQVTGSVTVGRRVMLKVNQPVDTGIITESVVTTSRIISMNLIGGLAIMQGVVLSVHRRQAVGLDLLGLQELVVVVGE